MTTPLERYCFSLPTELCAEIRTLIKQHKIMRDALIFYATAHQINDEDEIATRGRRAREALKALDQRTDGQI